MTLLRRAPREVYRVYGEAEFLADPLCDERMRKPDAAAGARRLNRIAGATVLVAAAGAVGGLIAWTSTPSIASNRRRERQRAQPAVASIGRTPASRPRVWRAREGADRSAHVPAGGYKLRRRDRFQSARPHALRRRIAPVHGSTLSSVSVRGRGGAPSPENVSAIAGSPAGTPSAAAAVAVAVRPAAPDQTEFGFER
jgi:hypothetical protein